MTFEYKKSITNKDGIPDLVIPVTEILKAQKHQENENAFDELCMFRRCIGIYTAYCGEEMIILGKSFDEFVKQIGRTGKVVFSCRREGETFSIIVRVVSNDGEKEVLCDFDQVVKGRVAKSSN